MANFATLAAIFAGLLVMSHVASAHRTIITTVEIDEDDERRGSGSCHEQVQTEGLEQCEQLFHDIGQGGSQLMESQHFRPCCQELRQVEQQCRCRGIRQVVREEQSEFRHQGMQRVVKSARELPSACGFSSPHHCEIRAIWF
ncbi:2S seed storage albumin protein-like [Rhodamnia argentea]|uniref:2S seed storage albumin protein-like n=1 Tax=Rhodamnia argentea TaxID=178133 RepID=A0ABM3H167_9MYRT|nr:2S seed storage albumin protein-like [Rhodamnia argentea]